MERPLSAPELVVIGCPSLDVLIVDGRAHQAPGGAAFITALAAQSAGAQVGLVARAPPTLPAQIAGAFGPGGLNRGGLHATQGQLPSFQIGYDTQLRATYTVVAPGMESVLSADDVPEDWLTAAWVHIAAIGGDAAQQLQVAKDLRNRGYTGRLSAGTFRRMVETQPDATRQLLERSDLFFMNAEEYAILLPQGVPKDHTGTLVITRGADGIEVFGGPNPGRTPAPAAEVVDATGAGDALCGGYLAGLATGRPPVEAGLTQAGIVLGDLGGRALLHAVAKGVQQRVLVDAARVSAIAEHLHGSAQSSALNFTLAPHLPQGHPYALPMLWIATLHQYGFWTSTTQGWQAPMYAEIDGVTYKGSDFIWAAFARAAEHDPSQLSAERMASEPGLFAEICTDDTGHCPVPDLDSHAALHLAHGRAMVGKSYASFLDEANHSDTPGATMMGRLRHQPGYMGDPLEKKASLLLLILSRRPEAFLDLRDPDAIVPIVDYHLMRACLRTGCVQITDPDLARRLEARAFVDGLEELAIRQACGRAIGAMVKESETSVAAVDGFFFVNGRRVCLEVEAPKCDACPIEPACARATEMFQPVYRTTNY